MLRFVDEIEIVKLSRIRIQCIQFNTRFDYSYVL